METNFFIDVESIEEGMKKIRQIIDDFLGKLAEKNLIEPAHSVELGFDPATNNIVAKVAVRIKPNMLELIHHTLFSCSLIGTKTLKLKTGGNLHLVTTNPLLAYNEALTCITVETMRYIDPEKVEKLVRDVEELLQNHQLTNKEELVTVFVAKGLLDTIIRNYNLASYITVAFTTLLGILSELVEGENETNQQHQLHYL